MSRALSHKSVDSAKFERVDVVGFERPNGTIFRGAQSEHGWRSVHLMSAGGVFSDQLIAALALDLRTILGRSIEVASAPTFAIDSSLMCELTDWGVYSLDVRARRANASLALAQVTLVGVMGSETSSHPHVVVANNLASDYMCGGDRRNRGYVDEGLLALL